MAERMSAFQRPRLSSAVYFPSAFLDPVPDRPAPCYIASLFSVNCLYN